MTQPTLKLNEKNVTPQPQQTIEHVTIEIRSQINDSVVARFVTTITSGSTVVSAGYKAFTDAFNFDPIEARHRYYVHIV